jgi:outer membrane protein OmpA-like peptidoglycan-associated protein
MSEYRDGGADPATSDTTNDTGAKPVDRPELQPDSGKATPFASPPDRPHLDPPVPADPSKSDSSDGTFNDAARDPADEQHERDSIAEHNNGQIAFEYNKSTLTPEARQQLDSLVPRLLDEIAKGNAVFVNGNASRPGSDDHNYQLSEDRANAVKDYLIRAGLDSAHIKAWGSGEAAAQDRDAETGVNHETRDNRNDRVATIETGARTIEPTPVAGDTAPASPNDRAPATEATERPTPRAERPELDLAGATHPQPQADRLARPEQLARINAALAGDFRSAAPSADAVETARARFTEGTATTADVQVLARQVISETRVALLQEAGPGGRLTGGFLNGYCEMARDNVASSLAALLANSRLPVQIERVSIDGLARVGNGPSVQGHQVTVARFSLPAGQVAVVFDPTYAQMFTDKVAHDGQRMPGGGTTKEILSRPHAAEVGLRMLDDGFHISRPDRDRIYANSLIPPDAPDRARVVDNVTRSLGQRSATDQPGGEPSVRLGPSSPTVSSRIQAADDSVRTPARVDGVGVAAGLGGVAHLAFNQLVLPRMESDRVATMLSERLRNIGPDIIRQANAHNDRPGANQPPDNRMWANVELTTYRVDQLMGGGIAPGMAGWHAGVTQLKDSWSITFGTEPAVRAPQTTTSEHGFSARTETRYTIAVPLDVSPRPSP